MATYYVGASGSDSNNGTTWALRKLTIGGGIAAASAGDTIYVGPGTYRELVTIGKSGSSGSPYTLIGDQTGANTDGIGGIVRWTGSADDIAETRAYCITSTNYSYWIVKGFSFDTVSTSLIRVVNGTHWEIVDCSFETWRNAIAFSNCTTGETNKVHRCRFLFVTTAVTIVASAATSNGADLIENVEVISSGQANAIDITDLGGTTIQNIVMHSTDGSNLYSHGLGTGQVTTCLNSVITVTQNYTLWSTSTATFTENYNTLFCGSTANQKNNVTTGANSNVYTPGFEPPDLSSTTGAGAWRGLIPASWSALRSAGTTGATDDIWGATRTTNDIGSGFYVARPSGATYAATGADTDAGPSESGTASAVSTATGADTDAGSTESGTVVTITGPTPNVSGADNAAGGTETGTATFPSAASGADTIASGAETGTALEPFSVSGADNAAGGTESGTAASPSFTSGADTDAGPSESGTATAPHVGGFVGSEVVASPSDSGTATVTGRASGGDTDAGPADSGTAKALSIATGSDTAASPSSSATISASTIAGGADTIAGPSDAGTTQALCAANGSDTISSPTDSGTAAAISSAWLDVDVGTQPPLPGAGYTTVNGTVSTVTGGTGTNGSTYDSFHFHYQIRYGDCSIIAQLGTVTGNALSAIEIRGTLNPDAAYLLHGFQSQVRGGVQQCYWRQTAGGSDNGSNSGNATRWLRIDRVGSTLTAYQSIDGSSWTQIQQVTATLPSQVYVGLLTASYDNAFGSAPFDNIALTGSANNYSQISGGDTDPGPADAGTARAPSAISGSDSVAATESGTGVALAATAGSDTIASGTDVGTVLGSISSTGADTAASATEQGALYAPAGAVASDTAASPAESGAALAYSTAAGADLVQGPAETGTATAPQPGLSGSDVVPSSSDAGTAHTATFATGASSSGAPVEFGNALVPVFAAGSEVGPAPSESGSATLIAVVQGLESAASPIESGSVVAFPSGFSGADVAQAPTELGVAYIGPCTLLGQDEGPTPTDSGVSSSPLSSRVSIRRLARVPAEHRDSVVWAETAMKTVLSYRMSPTERADFLLDWSPLLGITGDAIVSSEWSVTADDVTVESAQFTSSTTGVWVSGVRATSETRVVNVVTTAGGRTYERAIVISGS